MLLSNAPRKVALPFAENGEKNTIPEGSSPSAGFASMNDGFPPLTRQPVGSGGIPPQGLDMNGILYYLSSLNKWQSAGGSFVYDSTFATDSDVGGYPKGAILLRSDGEGFWLNLADNNVNNPDTGGANWQPINNVGITSKTLTGSDVTLTNAEAAKDIIVLSGTLTANVNLIMPVFVKQWIVANNTSGAFTVTVKTASGTGGVVTQSTSRAFYGDGTNIYGVNPLAATQAQVNAGTDTQTFLTPKTFNDAQQFVDIDTELSNKADLNGNAAQEFAVATATTGNSAVNKAQFDAGLSNKADLNGNAAQEFAVATATTGNSAVNKAQFDAKTSLATTTQAGIVEKATQAEMNAGTADAFPSAAEIFNGFASSGTVNGYIKLPEYLSGLILQWGFNNSNTNPLTISFPIAFTTACYGVFAQSDNDLSPVELEYTGVSDITTTTFAWNGIRAGVTAFTHGWWFAIGR